MFRTIPTGNITYLMTEEKEQLARDYTPFYLHEAEVVQGNFGPQIRYRIQFGDGTEKYLTLAYNEYRNAQLEYIRNNAPILCCLITKDLGKGKTAYDFGILETEEQAEQMGLDF
jgi:hypothetical protein